METVIYFIQYAQRRHSSQIHHSDLPLSELEVKEANQISDLFFNLNIEHVISSPYPYCLYTIKLFIETCKVPMTIHENLQERHMADTILDNFYDIRVKSWEIFDFKILGCERSFEAQERFVKAVEEVRLDHQGETIALSIHGNV